MTTQASTSDHNQHNAILTDEVDKYMAACDETIANKSDTELPCACRYQQPYLTDTNSIDESSVVEKFMAEGPSEQYAVFIDPTTGLLSISRPCICGASVDNGIEQPEQLEGHHFNRELMQENDI
jgi:hypothetical protein